MLFTRRLLRAVFLFALLVDVAPFAHAATITVTSMADNSTVDGLVTLREAITAANTDANVDGSTAGSGADTIVFAPAFIGTTQTILLGSALPNLTTAIVMTGWGASQLTVQGNGFFDVFTYDSFTGPTSINGLTIAVG